VSGVEDEVVALAVAPGLGHAEAEAGGFGEKCGFGDFPASFAGDVGALDFAGGRGMLLAFGPGGAG